MRRLAIAAFIIALPWSVQAAPTWQTISSEPGKRIELDRTSIKREDGGKVQAQGRVILEKELIDGKSGAGYRVIEAITRYDCAARSASTIKRIYKKNESEVVREEETKTADLPVRSGTLDDKVLREVCRPPKEGVTEVAQKANEAASQLKEANNALIKKEQAKAEAVKTSDAHSPIPSIRPNLKAAAEAAKQEHAPPVQREPLPAAPVHAPVKAKTVLVHSSAAHAPAHKPAKPAKSLIGNTTSS